MVVLISLAPTPPLHSSSPFELDLAQGESAGGHRSYFFLFKSGGGREIATLPDGSKRCFEDLMSHHREIIRDSGRIEAFGSFFSVLQDCFGDSLPPKPEVLEIYGRISTRSTSWTMSTSLSVRKLPFLSAPLGPLAPLKTMGDLFLCFSVLTRDKLVVYRFILS